MADNVITEWFIDGAWTSSVGGVELDERVRKNPGVRITRGVSDQQSQPTSAASEYEVNNRDGIFSNRNPLSPLYRKIPRYTQVRHRIPTVSGSRDGYVLSLRPDESGSCSTTDKAGLEITGDLDIRMEITPDTWRPIGGYALAGRYRTTGNNRVWLAWITTSGGIFFRTSPDGTSVVDYSFSSWAYRGRQVLRITLDVDNGAAGKTATLYRGDSMSGPWTTVQTITTAGTTSVYGSSTAPLEVCDVDSGSPISGHSMMYGKFHALEVRNGIAGTVVADLDVKSEDVGVTSWADAYGNTWTLTGTTRVGSDRIRHVGELDTVKYRWDESQRDVWLPQGTLGPLSRLQETGTPVASPLAYLFRSYPLAAGYWRLEEQSAATKAVGEGTSVNTSSLVDCTFTGSSPSGLAGSAGSVRLNSVNSSMWLGTAGRVSTGENSIIFCFKLPSLPAATTSLVRLTSNGTVRRWEMRIGPTNIALRGFNAADTQIISENALFGGGADPSQRWVMFQLTLSQEGANARYTTRWAGIGAEEGWWTHNFGGTTYAGTVGLIGQILMVGNGETAFAGAEFAHVVNGRDIYDVNTVDRSFLNAAQAWPGELAGERAQRIADENDLDLEIYGDIDSTQPMGTQPIDTPYVIINECAKVENGLLFDVRDRFAVGFRCRTDMENRFYENRNVDYEDSILARVPDPVEDSRYTRNIFTASRPGGADARFELSSDLTTGPLSTAEPPDGIGPRAGGDTYNAATDAQIESIAQYQTWLRTQDELRIPTLPFELARPQLAEGLDLRERIIACKLGDWINVLWLPQFVDADSGKQFITLGYTEEFNGDLWSINFNVNAAGAWKVPQLDHGYTLADDGTTTLKAALTSSATTATLVTPTTSRPWIYDTHADWPGSIQTYIAGELVTITACASPTIVGSNYEQVVTITRGGNDVDKAQVLGEVVEIANAYFLGL